MKNNETDVHDVLPALSSLVQKRRATQHFLDDPVPEIVLDSALAFAAQAPSGYNSQPWRFLILRDPAKREALKKAAFGQEKITEAPVVVVAFASGDDWKAKFPAIQKERARRLDMDPKKTDKQVDSALSFIGSLNQSVWLNRHVMIAFTYLMLAVEAQDWDTAPMEGFDPVAVKEALSLPQDAEVVALLAIGRRRDENQPHPGRLDTNQIAYLDEVGRAWPNKLK